MGYKHVASRGIRTEETSSELKFDAPNKELCRQLTHCLFGTSTIHVCFTFINFLNIWNIFSGCLYCQVGVRISTSEGKGFKESAKAFLTNTLAGNFAEGGGRARRPPMGSPIRRFSFRPVTNDDIRFQRTILNFRPLRSKSANPLLVK
jgi:hypothetical protein